MFMLFSSYFIQNRPMDYLPSLELLLAVLSLVFVSIIFDLHIKSFLIM